MVKQLLHYEVSWFDFEGHRHSETFTDIESALLFANSLKEKLNVNCNFYELSRIKEWWN